MTGTTIIASIVWGNTPAGNVLSAECATVSSLVQEGDNGAVLDLDPLFVDAAGNNYHLTAASPARDFMPAVIGASPVDFDGDIRDATPDMGADEYVGP